MLIVPRAFVGKNLTLCGQMLNIHVGKKMGGNITGLTNLPFVGKYVKYYTQWAKNTPLLVESAQFVSKVGSICG